jgi:hypothetical protein
LNLDKKLDRAYRAIVTPIALTTTLGLNAIAYTFTTLPNGTGAPYILVVYEFILFFLTVSVVSYVLSFIWQPVSFRVLAILAVLTTLVVAGLFGYEFVTFGNWPFIVLLPVEILASFGFAWRKGRHPVIPSKS